MNCWSDDYVRIHHGRSVPAYGHRDLADVPVPLGVYAEQIDSDSVMPATVIINVGADTGEPGDVFVQLPPAEARALAARLLATADEIEQASGGTR